METPGRETPEMKTSGNKPSTEALEALGAIKSLLVSIKGLGVLVGVIVIFCH